MYSIAINYGVGDNEELLLPPPSLPTVYCDLNIPSYYSSLCRQAPEMKLDAENTMLVFTVFHRDLIRTDRFVGMCIVPCSNIPRLQGTDAERQRAMIFDSLEKKVFRLSLFHPPKASSIRAELECRAKLNDSKAKKIIETIPSPNLK